MRAVRRLNRAFRRLDTSACDAALDRFEASTRKVHAEARTLRTNINCADCGAIADAVRHLTGNIVSLAGPRLRDLFSAAVKEPLPADMVADLRKLD